MNIDLSVLRDKQNVPIYVRQLHTVPGVGTGPGHTLDILTAMTNGMSCSLISAQHYHFIKLPAK